jgi:NADH dehydrogenase
VIEALHDAGVRRYLHMSALGSRPDAVSKYHQTKWQAEEEVRGSALEWTIFRPSLIHGPEGEFMRLMKRFMCSLLPPAIPYFGSGQAKIQPVSVKDVAHCFVHALHTADAVGGVVPLCGPRVYTWIELYNACRAHFRCARRWKPLVSQPAPVAKFAAIVGQPLMGLAESIIPPLGLFRFDAGQVQMSQEDNIADHTVAERLFDMQMRGFETELAAYADLVR